MRITCNRSSQNEISRLEPIGSNGHERVNHEILSPAFPPGKGGAGGGGGSGEVSTGNSESVDGVGDVVDGLKNAISIDILVAAANISKGIP